MGKKTARANNSFFLGSIIMIVLLLAVVFIFLMWAFRIYDRQQASLSGRYDITLEQSTVGHPMCIFVNDSLIMDATPGAAMTLTVSRFAEESTLFVVDKESDATFMHELPQESATIRVDLQGSEFIFR